MAARSTVAVAIALIISGCFPAPPNVAGHWQGRHPIPKDGIASEPVKNTLERVTLIIQPNGRYTMVWRGLDIAGDYSVADSEVTLTPKTVRNRPVTDLGEGMREFALTRRLRVSNGKLVGEFEGVKVVLTKI